MSRPTYYSSYGGRSEVVVINSANELAWIRLHWDDDSSGDAAYRLLRTLLYECCRRRYDEGLSREGV